MPHKVNSKKLTKKQQSFVRTNLAGVKDCESRIGNQLAELKETILDGRQNAANYVQDYQTLLAVNGQSSEALTLETRLGLIDLNWKMALKLQREMDVLRSVQSTVVEMQRRRELISLSTMKSRSEMMETISRGGRQLPLWLGDIGQAPPARAGRVTCEVTDPTVGELCAAFVKDMWILAECRAVNPVERTVVVRDVDDETAVLQSVGYHQILQLPVYRMDPVRNPQTIFGKRATVLALYPQTTCFYKGVVESPPLTADDTYLVTFDDEEYDEGTAPAVHVPQRYVINFREHPKHLTTKTVDEGCAVVGRTTEPPPGRRRGGTGGIRRKSGATPARRRFKMRDSEVPDETAASSATAYARRPKQGEPAEESSEERASSPAEETPATKPRSRRRVVRDETSAADDDAVSEATPRTRTRRRRTSAGSPRRTRISPGRSAALLANARLLDDFSDDDDFAA